MTHSSEISQNLQTYCINSLGIEYSQNTRKTWNTHFTKLQITCWKIWYKGSRESREPQSKDHVLSVGLPLPISNQTQLEMTGVTHGCMAQSSPYALHPSLLL